MSIVDLVANNLNRILAEQGSDRRITPSVFDPYNNSTSRTLKTFETVPVILAREFEGTKRLRRQPKGTMASIRPMPGGNIRLLLADVYAINDDAREGIDFDFPTDEEAGPLTFECASCHRQRIIEPDPINDIHLFPVLHRAEFWSRAKTAGWTCSKGREICPSCSGSRFLRHKKAGLYYGYGRFQYWDQAGAEAFSSRKQRDVRANRNSTITGYIGDWSDDTFEFVDAVGL